MPERSGSFGRLFEAYCVKSPHVGRLERRKRIEIRGVKDRNALTGEISACFYGNATFNPVALDCEVFRNGFDGRLHCELTNSIVNPRAAISIHDFNHPNQQVI